jgi:hypothetical protein
MKVSQLVLEPSLILDDQAHEQVFHSNGTGTTLPGLKARQEDCLL